MTLVALAALAQLPALPETPLPRREHTTVAGKMVTLPSQVAKATVLIFVTADCPIANRYAPEIRRTMGIYSKSVEFALVYVDPSATTEDIRTHLAEFEYRAHAIHDVRHELVSAIKATITPECAVIKPDGTVVYRGRVDDTYVEHGRRRERPTRLDLSVAIDETLAGKPVSLPIAPAIGCDIPR
jgi:hypothetical protein